MHRMATGGVEVAELKVRRWPGRGAGQPPRRRPRDRRERGPAGLGDGQAVHPADAGAEPRDVGAVDVQRDGHAITVVADPVDVTGRGETTHIAGVVYPPGHLRQDRAVAAPRTAPAPDHVMWS